MNKSTAMNGAAVKAELQRQGRKINWLADQTDVHRPTMSKYLSGRLECPGHVFDSIMSALDVPDPMCFVGPRDREGALVETGIALGLTPERYAELYEGAA